MLDQKHKKYCCMKGHLKLHFKTTVFRYITERDTVGLTGITPLDANARRGWFR